MKSTPRILLCLLVWGGATSLAIAMMPGTVHDGELLVEVRNKIVVLEYENPANNPWGLQLSELLAREIIGSIRGVTSVGVVPLRQEGDHVDLTVENVRRLAERQKARVVVWGEFFENADKIYLHSHLRIVDLGKSGPGPLDRSIKTAFGEVRATAPTLLVNFRPIEMTKASLGAIQRSHQMNATMRKQPTEAAAVIGQLSTTDGFTVVEVVPQWMRIRTLKGKGGWVHFAAFEKASDFSGLSGLVLFAQGVLQYLAGNPKVAEDTMSTYLKLMPTEGAANLALAHLILGNARFEARERTTDETVGSEFIRAAELMPNEAAASNYLAVVQLGKYGETTNFVPAMRDLEARLVHAVQAQNNLEALENLRVFYKTALGSNFAKPKAMTAEVYAEGISQQLTLIEGIAEQLRR